MPDDQQELRRINWSECFPFTNIFRTFRLAIQPSKLLLALVGLFLTYGVGRLLDVIWYAAGTDVLYGEIAHYHRHADFSAWHKERRNEINTALVETLLRIEKLAEPDAEQWSTQEEVQKQVEKDPDKVVQKIRTLYKKAYEDDIDLEKRRRKEKKTLAKIEDEQEREQRLARMVAESRRTYVAGLRLVDTYDRQGVFAEWMRFELHYAREAVSAIRMGNFLTGLSKISKESPATVAAPGLPDVHKATEDAPEPPGLLFCLVMMGYGLLWLACEHWFFALVFLLLALAVWSLAGGAICRLAAVHAARDEKLSIRQALTFAWRKWLGFFFAPIIPIILILVVGLFLVIGGMMTAIPGVGEILAGLLFFLALLGGFVIALVVVGAVGGGSLLWPTIAVEGSDSFDAISRSFSYVYAKPWRSLWYGLVAVVYGTFCYLFVRLFVLIVLKATHTMVGFGVGLFADRPEAGEGLTKLDAMWAAPTFEMLRPHFEWVNLMRAEPVGAILIMLWVYIVVGLAYAFLISFYFCGSTVIYYLLRREVDATDLDDVYLDEYEQEEPAPEEEAAEPAAEQPAPSEEPSAPSEPAEPTAGEPGPQQPTEAPPEAPQPEAEQPESKPPESAQGGAADEEEPKA